MKKNLLLILANVLTLITINSCVKKEYGLDNISKENYKLNVDVGVRLKDSLSFPLKKIISGADFLQFDDNGDAFFNIVLGDEKWSLSPDKALNISSSDFSTDFTVTKNPVAGSLSPESSASVDKTFRKNFTLNNIPDFIKSLKSVKIDGNQPLSVTIRNIEGSSLKKGFKIIFPPYLFFEEMITEEYSVKNNVITLLKDKNLSGGLILRASVSKMEFSPVLNMEGTEQMPVEMSVRFAGNVVFANGASSSRIAISVHIAKAEVSHLRGVFDKRISIPYHEIYIPAGSLSEEMKKYFRYIDKKSMYLNIDCENTSPVGFKISGGMSMVAGGTKTDIGINEVLNLPPSGNTRFLIGGEEPEHHPGENYVPATSWEQALSEIPDKIIIHDFIIETEKNETEMFLKGKNDIAISSGLKGYFAFAQNVSYTLNTVFDLPSFPDFPKNKVNVHDLILKATFINNFPINVAIDSIVPSDALGNRLPGIVIGHNSSQIIKAGGEPSDMSVNLKIENPEILKQFKKISVQLRLVSPAGAAGQKPPKINKNNNIELKDIKLRVAGIVESEIK